MGVLGFSAPSPLPHTSEAGANDWSALAPVPCVSSLSDRPIEKRSNSILRDRTTLEPVLGTPLSFSKQLIAEGHVSKGTLFDLKKRYYFRGIDTARALHPFAYPVFQNVFDLSSTVEGAHLKSNSRRGNGLSFGWRLCNRTRVFLLTTTILPLQNLWSERSE
jgi:hypothetical protein